MGRLSGFLKEVMTLAEKESAATGKTVRESIVDVLRYIAQLGKLGVPMGSIKPKYRKVVGALRAIKAWQDSREVSQERGEAHV
ncbi:MAG: hypothetical protein Q8K86_07330 [Candidatus Nanopelagicaceae bacterium]|nr:hypothetical protein [Candidatus Nanopelagicaceae bacterium]